MSNNLTVAAYEPLITGRALLDDTLGYRADSIRVLYGAFGNYLELSFELRTTEREIENWLDKGLGRHIELYSPSLVHIWDGYVSMVNANLGPLTLTRGPLLEVVSNKVRTVYSTIDTSTEPPTLGVREATDWVEDSDSQARYGIIEQVKSVGGSSEAEALQIANTIIADKADPETKEADSLSGGEPSLTVTCGGYIDWLNAYTYQSTTTGTQAADVKLKAILNQDPNGIFSSDQGLIESNAGTLVKAWEQDYDNIALGMVKGIVALGDDSYNRWTFGLTTGRKAYYKPIPQIPLYQRARSAPTQDVELYGSGINVSRWNVRAGEWVFYTDLLTTKPPSRRALRSDPRWMFIEQATYSTPWDLKLDGAQVSTTDQLLDRMGLGGSA